MDSSILNTIKKLLGIDENYTYWDQDLIIHINTAFNILYQLGVGLPYSITSATETWSDYLSDMSKLEMIKQYVYMKVRMVFDPPAGALKDAMQEQIKELEWRINVTVDPPTTFED